MNYLCSLALGVADVVEGLQADLIDGAQQVAVDVVGVVRDAGIGWD